MGLSELLYHGPLLRGMIIMLMVVVAVLAGFWMQMCQAEYDYEFYADGIGPVYAGMPFIPVSMSRNSAVLPTSSLTIQ